jgi:hypothetical protein
MIPVDARWVDPRLMNVDKYAGNRGHGECSRGGRER